MKPEIVACETAMGTFSVGETCPAACVRALSGAANATKSCVGQLAAVVAASVDELMPMVSGYCDGSCVSSFVPEVAQLMSRCAEASQGKSASALAAEWVPAHCTQVTTPSPPAPPPMSGGSPSWEWTPYCDVMTAMLTGEPMATECKVWSASMGERTYRCGNQVPPASLIEQMNFNSCAQPCQDLLSNVSESSCSLGKFAVVKSL